MALVLVGCDGAGSAKPNALAAVSPEELQAFVRQVKATLVFVEGGEFLMGDYGAQYGPEKLPYDANKDSKPVHKVELTSYSIDKFKVTNQEYQFYLKSEGLKLRAMGGRYAQEIWMDKNSAPNTPAHMDWYEADKYCNWLSKVSGYPFALPTEAQWEYAARSRGQFLMVATDDGTYKRPLGSYSEGNGPRGVNISASWDRKEFARKMGWKTGLLTPLPVDMFPPNPLGLYAMSDNGWEWVKDWYDPNYYAVSPVKDPQGPEVPAYKDYPSNNKFAKVLRGKDYADPLWGGGVNVQRKYSSPGADFKGLVDGEDLVSIGDKTARCVVNSPVPVK
jgi:formylglycine-generating enzyme required for sulfatase activity